MWQRGIGIVNNCQQLHLLFYYFSIYLFRVRRMLQHIPANRAKPKLYFGVFFINQIGPFDQKCRLALLLQHHGYICRKQCHCTSIDGAVVVATAIGSISRLQVSSLVASIFFNFQIFGKVFIFKKMNFFEIFKFLVRFLLKKTKKQRLY